ncbi:MAG: tRNA pseudouridine(55) synthase TruB, partial [Candidatus Firestonebacteria bacterium]|nr:tRNA pseudouridine(55) synthase TruB [Candidatus Firestonebacteria bacterium]
MLCGILPLYKPAGPSSNDVLRRISRWINVRSLGHSGTLDPAAEGLLVSAVDRATPVLAFLPGDKAYRARITLGRTTDTWDAKGQVLTENPVPALSEAEVAHHLESFAGVIQQTPPPFSALWHEGKRLYDLARQGRPVQKPPREVTIYQLRLVSYRAPEAEVDLHCSAGTYVRSLAMELGAALGCGAHLSHLVRTACSGFALKDAVTLETLEAEGPSCDWLRHVISPAQALAHLPAVEVN